MPVHNADIARAFGEIADLLQIQGANPFRVRAYRNAERVVESYGGDLAELARAGADLTELPGIGEDLAAKIREYAETGHMALLDRLHQELPAAIAELLQIPGLGPKRVKALYHDLEIRNAAELLQAARAGRVRTLQGFGEKTERRIEEAAAVHVGVARRFNLAVAAQYAHALVTHLKTARGVRRVEVAGSFRRWRETVGDLDILVTGKGTDAIARFVGYDEVAQVISRGPTRAAVVLASGLQVDLRVVPEESYGAALHYFTGSKAHNIAIRRLAQSRGLKINEYGVFKGRRRVAGKTEESVCAAVGLPWIPPELREDRGEIEAARAGRLPELVEIGDLRGDLHAHTRATDGHDTLAAMAEAAQTLGRQYLAITEHSRRLTMARGLDARRLARQGAEIDRLNAGFKGFRLLRGIEVDILEDGSLDLPDAALAHLDLVVGAVHSRFDLPRARQTERILRAMDRPHFSILAHPSGRLLDKREAFDVDMEKIVRKARARGCFLELNSQPKRLDLTDTHCRMARDAGVPVAISSDAHSTTDLGNLILGVGQARRGWLAAADVLNSRPLPALLALLAPTMRAKARR
ncbi:MAG TPA: DNA polymerase/3'-5' exonuclease PolX [Pelomicrobium sp.]|nr:DNA polymerase/3'-5' exonuclease PolX [Pelomicrobium sp.]